MDGDAIIACISICGYHILLAQMEVMMYLCHKGDVFTFVPSAGLLDCLVSGSI